MDFSFDKAAIDARYWTDVAELLTTHFEAKGVLFFSTQPEGRTSWPIHTSSLTSLLIDYFESAWHLNDFRQNLQKPVLAKGFATDHELVSRKEMDDIPYYRDLMLKHDAGICIGIGCKCKTGLWIAGIICSNDRPPLTTKEVEEIKAIQLLLQKSVEKSEQTANDRLEEYVLLSGESGNDIMILDGAGRIIDCFEGCGLVKNDNQWIVGNKIQSLLGETHASKCQEVLQCPASKSKKVTIKHTIGNECVDLTMAQLPESLRHFYARRKVIVKVSRARSSTANLNDILIDTYGLTPSEAKAAIYLSKGYSIGGIAQKLGNKETSVRQKFKSIYPKTNVSTQAQLAVLVLSNAD